MLQKLTTVAPRNNDPLTLRRGQALAQVLLLFMVIVVGLAAISLGDRDPLTQITTAVGMAIFVVVYAINRSGRVRLAVVILLIGGTCSTISGALITQRPLPMLFFMGLIVVVAAAFGRPRTPIIWAAALSALPFLINVGVYGTLLAPTAPILLPDGSSLPSISTQEFEALALLWMLAGSAYLSSHLLNQMLEESRAATEQALAINQELRRSEERFSKIFQLNPIANCIATLPDGRIADVNDRYIELTQYSKEEVIGRTADELNLWVEPGDLERITRLMRSQGAIRDIEVGLRTKEGQQRTLLQSIEYLDLAGERCILIMFYDITERKRAEAALRETEERFSKIFQFSPVAISLRSRASGRFIDVNDSYTQLTEYSRSEIIGYTSSELGLLSDPSDQQRILQLLNDQGAARDVEIAYRTKSGLIRQSLASVELVDIGDTACILTMFYDITERKRLEAQLLQAQKMETVGRLAGGIAHDFNNLLTAITGYADLAIEELPPTNPVRGDIEELRRAADRATSLTRQLLAFARKQRIEPRVVDLNQLIRDMHEFIRRLIGEHIELITLPAPDLSSVQVDTNQIEQVIVNLVVNARDAMPQGGRLVIETANVELDSEQAAGHIDAVAGHYVLLMIGDTGVGMDTTVKEHLFEPFFTTKAPGKGTGLGLATCYGIVRQHGGHIWPYSELGHGTIMKVYLPRVDAQADQRPEDGARVNPRGDETILLVEDEPAVRDLAARVLRGQGYTVLEASDGVEALRVAEQARDARIDLLLTDVIMPRMGGSTLTEQLSAMRPGIKVLFVSGYTEDAIRLGSQLAAGAQFLHKPFSPAALAQKVRGILDT